MEPIQLLEGEPEHVARLAQMRGGIYSPVCDLEAEVFPSDEPLPRHGRLGYAYAPIMPGEAWADIFGCAWFRVRGTVPMSAAGKHVVAHLDVGGEGLVFDADPLGEPIAAIAADTGYADTLEASVSKTIIEVSPCARGGEPIEYFVDAGYNGRYNDLVGKGTFRFAQLCIVDDGLYGYYYDYLTIASLLTACADTPRAKRIDLLLDKSWDALAASLADARAVLAPVLHGTPDPTFRLTAIGHAHLDLAWLWPIRETKRKAARTFTHQLAHIERYPGYVFGASQPQQFIFLREQFPQLYARAKEAAGTKGLECQGGMWVEVDTNLASGESLIRQIVYGKRFFSEEFGSDMRICWLPDVFGYNGNLPQLLRKSGMPYFLTIKLSWNEHNRFPYHSFVWRGIDGSEVLVHMPPADTYTSAGCPADAAFARDNYAERGIFPEALLVYGDGDGGGGPGQAHIEMVRRQASLEGSPAVELGSAEGFFDRLAAVRDRLPVYSGELYLEKHQGTYTTQADNKRYNRRCEYLLQDVESLGTLARLLGRPYPREALGRLWKEVLLYQFHDILPGSSIKRVYDETGARYPLIEDELQRERADILRFLADDGGPGKPAALSAFNPTSFERPWHVEYNGAWYSAEIPPHGFSRLRPVTPEKGLACTDDTLENDCLLLRFSATGELVSLVDKATGFEYAAGPLNRLVLYQDRKLHYNAWDIDWEYYKAPCETLGEDSHEVSHGPAQVMRRSTYTHGTTKLVQDVILSPGSRVVIFRTTCDWHEDLRMLRADFLPSIFSPQVKCDIQLGSIMRSTSDATPVEKAQFEVCAHKYVDISDDEHGISLLNDCKYGHRVKDGLISLNLLRSTVYPDETADRHRHRFTYALLPHGGRAGIETIREAYFLNKPPVAFPGAVPVESIARTDREQVVIETIKAAENGNGVVLRLYECLGASCECSLQTCFGNAIAYECDLLENRISEIDLARLSFTPFEIKTIEMVLRP